MKYEKNEGLSIKPSPRRAQRAECVKREKIPKLSEQSVLSTSIRPKSIPGVMPKRKHHPTNPAHL